MTMPPPAGPTNPEYPGQQYPPAPSGYPPPATSGGYFPPTAPPAGGPDGATPAPPKKKTPVWVRPVAILAGIALIAGLAWFFNRESVQNAEVGDCIQVESETEFNIVDCTAAEAGFKVLAVEDGFGTCTDPDVDSKIYTKSGDAKSWCLQLVISEGQCVETDVDKVDCGAPTAEFKAVKILEGTQDETGCPAEATTFRAYQAANKVICYTDA